MRYLNKILLNFMIGVNCVLFIAYIIFVKIKVVIPDYLYLLLGASVASIIAYIYAYKKLLDSIACRYVVLGFNMIIYIGIIFWTGVDIGYIAGMAVALIYILFMDTTLMYVLMFIICMPNIASIIMNVVNGHMHDGRPLHITSLVMQFFAIMWYCWLLRYVISVVVKVNNEKIDEINAANSRTQKLMDGLLTAAKKVRDNVGKGNELINELDEATDGTNLIFSKIAEGNESNVDSVEKQTEMTLKITDMINKVVNDTNEAQKTTYESIKGLNSSKEFLGKLKGESKEIINVNRKIFGAIDKFVHSTKEVKKITEGIEELSEEINLLSINARIESAKAGEAGKGFAVVATHVNNLAIQTTNLAKNIQDVLNVLEYDAINAQSFIDEVEETVANENITLDNTIGEFNYMEDKMKGLSEDMKNILTSTDDVVSYNNAIREHIEQLSAETEEVTAYIEEVLSLNENNKKKMNETTAMMNELSVVVDSLRG